MNCRVILSCLLLCLSAACGNKTDQAPCVDLESAEVFDSRVLDYAKERAEQEGLKVIVLADRLCYRSADRELVQKILMASVSEVFPTSIVEFSDPRPMKAVTDILSARSVQYYVDDLGGRTRISVDFRDATELQRAIRLAEERRRQTEH